LAADFSRLGEEVRRAERGGADYIHIDVMDGLFVPNITLGPAVIAALRPHTELPFDVHLMIQRPGRYVKEFVEAGANFITIHLEAEEEPAATVAAIRDHGARPGLAIKPNTTLEAAKRLLRDLDLFLVMTVEPGFGGQAFMSEVLPKVEEAREFLDEEGLHTELEVDGGIDGVTAGVAARAGARVLVAGTGVYDGQVGSNIAKIRQSAEEGLEAPA
ncbi:MAG: ribulose-phosphate 3-epimerase, partial [Thermoplasmata archaeon]|nr:ribulose-phosphate 3-epimerase [Thermoplasmata archaeon]